MYPIATLIAIVGLSVARRKAGLAPSPGSVLDVLVQLSGGVAGNLFTTYLQTLPKQVGGAGLAPDRNHDLEQAMLRSAALADLFCIKEALGESLQPAEGRVEAFRRLLEERLPYRFRLERKSLGVLSDGNHRKLCEARVACELQLRRLEAMPEGITISYDDLLSQVDPNYASAAGRAAWEAVTKRVGWLPDECLDVFVGNWFSYLCLQFHFEIKHNQAVSNILLNLSVSSLSRQLERSVEEVKALITQGNANLEAHLISIETAISDTNRTPFDAKRQQLQTPRYFLGKMGKVYGFDSQANEEAARWLNSSERVLFVCGAPGIGKSTLAKCILRCDLTEHRCLDRRFELQCDDIANVDELVSRMAGDWFGATDQSSARLRRTLLAKLAQAPCAILLDNFETLLRGPTKTRRTLESFVSELTGVPNLWLVAGVQGLELPAGPNAVLVTKPRRLSPEDAVSLFCLWSRVESHARDKRLPSLLEAVDYVPLAVVLLGGSAIEHESLEQTWQLWSDIGIRMILTTTRRGSGLEDAFEIAIRSLDPEALSALRTLAWLPAGVVRQDCSLVLPGGLLAVSALERSALAYWKGERLRMLKPLSAYVARIYPSIREEREFAGSRYLDIASRAKGDRFDGDEQAEVLSNLRAEYPNVLVVLAAALEAGELRAIEATCGMGRFSSRAAVACPETLTLLATAAELASKLDRPEDAARCFVAKGRIARDERKFQPSRDEVGKAQEIFLHYGNRRGIGDCLALHADIDRLEESPINRSAELYNRARSHYKQAGDRRGEAMMLYWLADVSHGRGRRSTAERFLRRAASLFRGLHDYRDEAFCMLSLGTLMNEIGETKTARSLFDAAQSLFQKAADKDGEVSALLSRANVAMSQGDRQLAVQEVESAITIYSSLDDLSGQGRCIMQLATIAKEFKDFPKAKRFQREALKLFGKAGDRAGQINCFSDLGDTLRQLSQFKLAERVLLIALRALRSSLPNREEEAWCLWTLSVVCFELDREKESADLFRAAVALYLRPTKRSINEAEGLEVMGSLANANGFDPERRKLWSRALEIYTVRKDTQAVERVTHMLSFDRALTLAELRNANRIGRR